MFKELFPSYIEFSEIQQQFMVDFTGLDYYFFNRLFREYANFETAYDTPHDFYGAFFNVWEDAVFEITKRKEIADILNAMGGDDYTKDTNISTFAQNPNETPKAPSDLLNYFNTQNYSEVNMKRVEAYARAYQLIPRGQVQDFVKRFNKLFLACINDNTYLYNEKRSKDNE